MENAGAYHGHLKHMYVQPFGTCMLLPFDNLVVSWYIFSRFGILYPEKSGSPEWQYCAMWSAGH
jgi:hypothetical protein